jgi:muconate cycloisomerase
MSVSGVEPARAAELATWAMNRGLRALKVKVGIEPEGDVARVKAVRQAIGPRIPLGVDANGGWTQRAAVAIIRRLVDECGIYFAEQPVPPVDVESDVLSVYVGKGGIGPARKIAAVAEAAGLTCTVGSNLELGIASAAMAHLAAATFAIGAEEFPCDILGPLAYEHTLVAEPLDVRDGTVKPPDGPGLGVELEESAVARYRA